MILVLQSLNPAFRSELMVHFGISRVQLSRRCILRLQSAKSTRLIQSQYITAKSERFRHTKRLDGSELKSLILPFWISTFDSMYGTFDSVKTRYLPYACARSTINQSILNSCLHFSMDGRERLYSASTWLVVQQTSQAVISQSRKLLPICRDVAKYSRYTRLHKLHFGNFSSQSSGRPDGIQLHLAKILSGAGHITV